MKGDPHPERPGRFNYRVVETLPTSEQAVWMDGEYVGTATEVELRSVRAGTEVPEDD